jgi:hypothetical protein
LEAIQKNISEEIVELSVPAADGNDVEIDKNCDQINKEIEELIVNGK